MSRLLSASLLAFGIAFATPSVAQSQWDPYPGPYYQYPNSGPIGYNETIKGAHLYIVDPTKPVEISYYGPYGAGNVGFVNVVDKMYVTLGTLDIDGNQLDNYAGLLSTRCVEYCTGVPQNRSLASSEMIPYKNNPLLTPGKSDYHFLYTPSEGAYELVFEWFRYTSDYKVAGTYRNGYSRDYAQFMNVGWGPEYEYTVLSLSTGDGWGSNIIIGLRNVSFMPPTPVPEPETYAMMLVGLGLIGAVARRRRRSL